MQMFKALIIAAASILSVSGDECQTFCEKKLGKKACAKGSSCAKSGGNCRSLYWVDRDEGTICHSANDDCEEKEDPVSCKDAGCKTSKETALKGNSKKGTTGGLKGMKYCSDELDGCGCDSNGCCGGEIGHCNEDSCACPSGCC